jgi:serine/threonine-protein kinase
VIEGAIIAGRYELLGELARGGMGCVWRARELDEGQVVAIKLQPAALPDDVSQKRFDREVSALRQLQNPYTVRIFDSGQESGVSYIVMELLRGETLSDRLGRCTKVPPNTAARIIGCAAQGLAAVHACGIVHRDVKPSNLFLVGDEPDVVVKVFDFGIAKSSVQVGSDETDTGVIGSPAYMSPEQCRGERVTAASDLWSLAVVAFKLLTGAEPFTEQHVPATLTRICSGRPIARLDDELPGALRDFFKIAFRINPKQRFKSAQELAASFARACSGVSQVSVGREGPTQTHQRVPRARSRAWRVGLGIALSAVALVVGARAVVQAQKLAPPPAAPTITTRSAPAPRDGQATALRPVLADAAAKSDAAAPPSPEIRKERGRGRAGVRAARPPSFPNEGSSAGATASASTPTLPEKVQPEALSVRGQETVSEAPPQPVRDPLDRRF